MNTRHAILSSVLLASISAVSLAAPLPAGTLLTIEPGVPWTCATGSCLGINSVIPPMLPSFWYLISPGTDGGIIVGKNQKGGGQHASPYGANVAPGEITAVWNANGYGTFATLPLTTIPDASANLFSDTSCEGSACLGVTELRAWYADWYESVYGALYLPFGRTSTCNSAGCKGVTRWTVTPDGPPGLDGDHYELEFMSPQSFFCAPTACADFWLRLRGTIWLPGSNAPPVALPRDFVAQQNTTTAWVPMVSDRSNDPLTCRLGTPPPNGVASVATDCSSGTYQPNTGFYGFDRFTYISNDGVNDSSPGMVTVYVNSAPNAVDLNITASSGAVVTWTPYVFDRDTGTPASHIVTCRLGTPPVNGIATVMSCGSGTYQSNPGFIGTDSFTYIANDGQADSKPGTVTVAVTEGSVDQTCVQNNPVTQFTQTGKQGTLSITFTGNIVSHTNKEVKVCPGTALDYQTSSTKGLVICKIKNSTNPGTGMLRIRDHLKCTDKPGGKDKVQFKVKSGVK